LVAILDYFDDAGREIKVSELPAAKKEFILKAFASARDKVTRALMHHAHTHSLWVISPIYIYI